MPKGEAEFQANLQSSKKVLNEFKSNRYGIKGAEGGTQCIRWCERTDNQLMITFNIFFVIKQMIASDIFNPFATAVVVDDYRPFDEFIGTE